MARAEFEYSTHAGSSVYPVHPGCISVLQKPAKCYNAEVRAICSHHVFIWVMRSSKTGEKVQPKRRKIRCAFYYVPTITALSSKVFAKEQWVQAETLVLRMRKNGYKELSGNTLYHYNDTSIKSFYVVVQDYLDRLPVEEAEIDVDAQE